MARPPRVPHETVQVQYRRCGKRTCKKCQESKGHGPYLYAYTRVEGKLKSRYIGTATMDEVIVPQRKGHE